MKKRNKNNKTGLKFTAIFVLTVMAIMSLTSLVVTALTRTLFLSPLFGKGNVPPHTTLVVFCVTCIAVGTVLSVVFSNIVIRPIDRIIEALNKVIDGDYTVKVTPKGIRRSQRLGARFNHMTEELQSISTLNEDFVNNFSHEFKTPITSICGFAKLMRSEGLSEEKKNEYLDIIIRESEKLALLSSNALLFAKIENWMSAGETVRCNVTEQIRENVVLLMEKQSAKNIEFALEGEDLFVDANRDLLGHVWMNVLDNAIKFTPENEKITIAVSSAHGTVTVVISDTGVGMSEEVLANVFNKFYQGDTSHSKEGNGLGLPIAKKVTELHGGSLGIVSAPGKGTSVTVTLPESRG